MSRAGSVLILCSVTVNDAHSLQWQNDITFLLYILNGGSIAFNLMCGCSISFSGMLAIFGPAIVCTCFILEET
jgi:hypothetical protein